LNRDSMLVVVDSVIVPIIMENMSFARVPDGNAVWAVQAPTWNASNTTTSLPELPVSSVTIYPTLVAESFHVQNASGSMLTITDLTGSIRYKTNCVSDDELIYVSYLQRGLYIVTVGNQAMKIVKK